MIDGIQNSFKEKFISLQEEVENYKVQMNLYKTNAESYEAELQKMKKLYDEQLEEVQIAFREKNAQLQGQLDKFKNQIGSLLAD